MVVQVDNKLINCDLIYRIAHLTNKRDAAAPIALGYGIKVGIDFIGGADDEIWIDVKYKNYFKYDTAGELIEIILNSPEFNEAWEKKEQLVQFLLKHMGADNNIPKFITEHQETPTNTTLVSNSNQVTLK